jgi:hypothetical protein
LEIGSLVVMHDVFLLELHDWLSDFSDILIEDFSLQDREELRVVIHDSLPIGFPDRVALAISVSSVNKDLPLVETNVESADNCVLTKSELELFSLIDLVSNVVLT